MGYPSFSVGDTLAASDMNAVGLWRITTCTVTSSGGTGATASNGVITVGTGNTSVTVNDAFGSSFENYRIIISGLQASTNQALCLRYGSSTANYYGAITYTPYNATTITVANNNVDSKQFISLTSQSAPDAGVAFDSLGPNLARRTFTQGQYYGRGYIGYFGGSHEVATAYTAFTIFNESGTITGGTIRVYGYRN